MFNITKNNKEVNPNEYFWDEKTKTFCFYINDVVIDFKQMNGVNITCGNDCTVICGSNCVIKTGVGCTVTCENSSDIDCNWNNTVYVQSSNTIQAQANCVVVCNGESNTIRRIVTEVYKKSFKTFNEKIIASEQTVKFNCVAIKGYNILDH